MGDNEPADVPVFQEYMNAILEVLRRNVEGMPIESLDKNVFELMELPSTIIAMPHDPAKPDRGEAAYRSAWARTYLKKAGLITNPTSGTWAATDKGRGAGTIDAYAVASEVSAKYAKTPAGDGEREDDGTPTDEDASRVLDEELTAARVSEDLATQIREVRDRLVTEGILLSPQQAERQLRSFRDKFGPDLLRELDGAALLTKMHGRGTKDSLVYWLEFKDDDEFPAAFGGIGGGSALKFGLYLSAETEQWMTGSGRQQRRLSLDEAIALTRTQRDQLVAGVRVLETFPKTPLAADYLQMQARLVKAAPDLAETSWGHKYFALLFPELLEPIHGQATQRHHLFKLLKIPADGRYVNARVFVGVAQQLGMSVMELALTLHRRNGPSHDYWRVGTTEDGSSEWQRMLEGGFASVGWAALGDLSGIEQSSAGREALRAQMEAHYPGLPQVVSKAANQLFNFARAAQERDIVVAMEGQRVRGVGRVVGPYFHRPDDGPFPHRRVVEWLLAGEWRLPETEGLLTTFTKLGRSPRNIVEIEGRLLGRQSAPKPLPEAGPPSTKKPSMPPPALTGVPARVHAVLHRKRQVILHGPPGTGKTYWAERAARELASRSWFAAGWEQLDEEQRTALEQGGAVEICAFHPAYGYEDFLEGYRPVASGGALTFELRDGVFKRMCDRASGNRERGYYLIVDEINRGDIPRIFGELLMVLEKDKREKTVTLPLSGAKFSVPDNVYVLGTMNTADRSIALLDAALRRRFGFIELLPDSTTLAGVAVGGLPLGPWLDELNRRVVQHAGRDARSLQVGHSYLVPGGNPVRDLAQFAEILRDDIIPLLAEYCYDDFDALERILGDKIVLKAKHRVDESLLEAARHEDLLHALRAAFAGIMATKQAVEADATASDAGGTAPADDDPTSP